MWRILRGVAGFSAVILLASLTADAQFKVVGPAPYPEIVARQKIRTLLAGVDPSNHKQTIDTLTGLLSWYRDLIDEELIAQWQKDARKDLPEVIEALADSRVAVAVIEFSWRKRPPGAFDPAYAPLFGNLMARFPQSAQPFLDDLLAPLASGRQPPDLSMPEVETLCRILLDMPDIGTWRKSALEILPHYRRVAEGLLAQDLNGGDREKSYQAQRWLADLKTDVPRTAREQPNPRTRSTPRPAVDDSTPIGEQASRTTPPRLPPQLPPPPPPAAPIRSEQPPVYSGPKSGTLECSGAPVPQNAEYVFRNLPAGKLQLDYDTKTWEARLVPGDGGTQRVIVRNKSSGPQKRCVVRWNIIP